MTREQQMKFHELQALWWMHSASNGHAATRNVEWGTGVKLTADELRDDAMSTSKRHMDIFREIAESEE